jgi:hypothetical protein
VYLENIPERTLLTVRAGRLDGVEVLPEQNTFYAEKFDYSSSYYRNLTSGNKGKGKYAGTNSGYRTLATDLGDVFIPEDWYDEEPSDKWPIAATEFPEIYGYTVNEFGEYFDADNQFMGSFDDLVEMGYLPAIDAPGQCNIKPRSMYEDMWD